VLNWVFMLAVMSALTMIVGNLFALIQDNVKTLIANICVADVGYNLIGITSVTTIGLMGNLYFFLIGGITTALSFMAVGLINRHGFKTLEDFSGIGLENAIRQLGFATRSAVFCRCPPSRRIHSEIPVFTAAIEADLSWLAIIGVITSVIQTAYLLRLINYMYGRKPEEETRITESKRLLIPIFLLVGAIIVLGLYPR